MAFVADRLFETGDTALASVVDQYQLKSRIKLDQLSHLLFTFTGSNPSKLLTANLNAYTGKVPQVAVGLRVPIHQAFIKQVFEKVIADGNKP